MIFGWQSGSYMDVTSGAATYNTAAQQNTAMLLGEFLKSTGEVYKNEKGEINYFKGFTQVTDPFVANLTTLRGIQGQSALKSIADPTGRVILSNPTSGILGSLGKYYLTGPSNFGLDMNLIKRVHIDEFKSIEIRATAIDILNCPQWGDPTTDINSLSFGRITGASGNRTMLMELRVNF